LVAIAPDSMAAFEAQAEASAIPIAALGKTGGADLTIGETIHISIEELGELHESWLPDLMQ
ncbi:MAG: hypothetical protein VW981_07595, partial [Rhodobiaceae bacterium]